MFEASIFGCFNQLLKKSEDTKVEAHNNYSDSKTDTLGFLTSLDPSLLSVYFILTPHL